MPLNKETKPNLTLSYNKWFKRWFFITFFSTKSETQGMNFIYDIILISQANITIIFFGIPIEITYMGLKDFGRNVSKNAILKFKWRRVHY